MHRLPTNRRAIAFMFPAIIVVVAVLAFPTFIAAGRAWWLLFILGPAAGVAWLIFVEFRAIAIGFDAAGVHYRTVGYAVDAPWQFVTFKPGSGKPILLVAHGQRTFSPWFGIMYKVLTLLMPRRVHHANTLMTMIPLYFFLTSDSDAVMRALRATAPEGKL